MAPEVYNRCYSKQSDMWSLGMMMYHLLTRRFPFWCAICLSFIWWVPGQYCGRPVLSLCRPTLLLDSARWLCSCEQRCFTLLPFGLLQQVISCCFLQSGILLLCAEASKLHAGRVWISAAQAHWMTSCVL